VLESAATGLVAALFCFRLAETGGLVDLSKWNQAAPVWVGLLQIGRRGHAKKSNLFA
jgi:hypothetical protein